MRPTQGRRGARRGAPAPAGTAAPWSGHADSCSRTTCRARARRHGPLSPSARTFARGSSCGASSWLGRGASQLPIQEHGSGFASGGWPRDCRSESCTVQAGAGSQGLLTRPTTAASVAGTVTASPVPSGDGTVTGAVVGFTTTQARLNRRVHTPDSCRWPTSTGSAEIDRLLAGPLRLAVVPGGVHGPADLSLGPHGGAEVIRSAERGNPSDLPASPPGSGPDPQRPGRTG